MSVRIDQFRDYFAALHQDGHGKPIEPFPWQARLAGQVASEGWPQCIDLPTASGKTACIDIAVFVLACQAELPAEQRTVGRRIFFTVNRRVIVDEAYDRARTVAERLLDAESRNDSGVLGQVARALRSMNECRDQAKAPPLDIAQLRGGIFRDVAWARSLTQPTVICTTADQLGSRLLFRGYGVSDSMKPVHAALCGCDALVLLDEAHVTRAFSQTMQLLPRYQAQHSTAPRLTFVQMTATPAGQVGSRFELDAADQAHPVLRSRLQAHKPATLCKLDRRTPLDEAIARHAIASLSDQHNAIGVIVNRVQSARDAADCIEARLRNEGIDADVRLIIGRMRPIDRDDLQKQLRSVVGPQRPDRIDKPVFIVATQCLEVGADYDFDGLITECASIDALRQRFGRLNRRGRSVTPVALILATDDSLKGDDPIYGDAISQTWQWLNAGDDTVDFGIAAMKAMWDKASADQRSKMLAPADDAAVLLPAHLDILCQTAPQPEPSPDVSYFIHGPERNNAEVSVCWRADLGADPAQWPEVVRLLPPASPECMTVPLHALRQWMLGQAGGARDADVPVLNVTEDERRKVSSDVGRKVVVWRGVKDVSTTQIPDEVHPGDTVVIRTQDFGWQALGHIPGAPAPDSVIADMEQRRDAVDQAERVSRDVRRRVVVRLHPAFGGRSGLRGLPAADLRDAIHERMRAELADEAERARVLRVLEAFERHPYAGEGEADDPPDEVIIFKRLLDPREKLVLPAMDEDGQDDNLSQSNHLITMQEHAARVVDQVELGLAKLGMGSLEPTLRHGARWHDLGKIDVRFQAMLAGTTPYEAMERPMLLAKSDSQRRTIAEAQAIRQRAMLPEGFRHEMLSTQIAASRSRAGVEDGMDRDLLLHLIAAHHGHARPFAPVIADEPADHDLLSLQLDGWSVTGRDRDAWIPAHRLDSGIAERFWDLTRRHGWWGLAWLEAIVRLADQQASAAEQAMPGIGGSR